MTLEGPIFDQRFRFILIIFLLWAFVISGRLFYFSIINRESAFGKMETESQKRKRVRAMRGRILSHDGTVVASSRRISMLCMKTDIKPDQLNSLVEILYKELKIMRRQVMVTLANSGNEKFIVLRRNLTSSQIDVFSKFFVGNDYLYIKMDFKRDVAGISPGKIVLRDGVYVGVSGFEKKYDAILRGQDLIFEIMVDRQNREIEKTYNEISPLKTEQDVYLSKEEWP